MGETVHFGDYQLVERLGVGSFSFVWKAIEKSANRTVALKVLKPKFAKDKTMRERFKRAAQALLVLNHPNIVVGYDAAEDGEIHYVAMQFMEGGSLGQVLTPREGEAADAVDEVHALQIAFDCVRALQYLHGRQMVHRDLKPSNILFSGAGVAKLGDFVLLREEMTSTNLTALGTAVGSPHYMAPEQAMGQQVDSRADQYGLGCVLFHMLTGRPPFEGASPLEVMLKRLKDDFPPVERYRPVISATTSALVQRLGQRDPDERFADTAEARREIESALNELGA